MKKRGVDKKYVDRMWGGRFKKSSSMDLVRFTTKTDVLGFKGADYNLLKYEILGTCAHTLMLMKTGIISDGKGKKILKVLYKLKDDDLSSLSKYEDIHSFVESKIIAETGLTPHICRSRNDQVILVERLYVRDAIIKLIDDLINLIDVLLSEISKYMDIIVPAYTHWQQADITTFSHLLLSYVYMLFRDLGSLFDLYKVINFSPLGAGAVAGCILPIDREYTASLLGFEGVQSNTIDVVTSRWEYQSRYLFSLELIMRHLSIISTDLIFFSSNEIRLIELDDSLTTGSSSLPHKKNPDVLELIIGKAEKINGYLSTVLSIGGSSSGYHRESQEGKWMMIDATEDVLLSIKLMSVVIKTMSIDKKASQKILEPSLSLVQLTNYLSFHLGISFRIIHEILGEYLIKSGFHRVNTDELIKIIKDHGVDINLNLCELDKFNDFRWIINEKKHVGAPANVENEVNELKKKLSVSSTKYRSIINSVEKSFKMLYNYMYSSQ